MMERQHDPEAYDVDVALADGTRLTGTVTGVRNGVILSLTYSTLAAKHRMRAWIELVALTAARPDRAWRSVAVGRGGRGPERRLFGPLPVEEANAALAELIALYRAGLRSPLPLPCKSAAQYALRRRHGNGVSAARIDAQRSWVSDRYPGEQADAENVLIYGPPAPLSVLTGQAPEPGEGGPGWPVDETDRFGLLARRLWGRLLDAETTVQT